MKRLLLVGAGHAHAQVLRDFAARPMPGVAITVVSPSALAPYSGMVPGWLAGHYRFDEICIDFEALSRAAGATWVADEVIAFDADQRMLMLRSGTVLGADLVSINIGSTLRPPAVDGARVLSLRPLGDLHRAWEALLADLAAQPQGRPIDLTAVGGGAAGVESLLAVRTRLAALCPGRPLTARLLTRSPDLLPGMSRLAARQMHGVLAAAGAAVHTNTGFDEQAPPASPADAERLVLWATGAQAHRWPGRSTLAASETGFIRIDDHLRSVSHPAVFAVGDCAQWADPLPKAGVYAVRMGPVLTRNLRACLGDGAPQTYSPQRRFLALLATGDRRAIATWGPFAAQGAWAWRWKDSIDRGFIAGFARDRGAAPPGPTAGPPLP
ncbi:FAD-dependent oxidoreductase [Ideonella sp. A 288]|uniref:FAD-dependent oxidoreductase n=1 Tax=Ideonella sp. A 288 TaxID=1962181 RepID=UPI000B4AC588|nr:FAD-dependent oxidoreductase [Ideonella sp. A 288]